MRKERKHIELNLIEPNTGQLDWLPRNPRQWTRSDIDRTADSILEDTDFLEDRPLLLVGNPAGGFIVFAGNLRREGALAAKLKTVPCVLYIPDTEEDHATIKRRAMKDNGTFGRWDWDELANNWDDLPLTDWGVPSWPQEDQKSDAQRQMENGGLSTEGGEGDEEYDEFVDKFKQKLTTDDCYTPPAVYDAIKAWVSEKVHNLDDVKVIRPFFPGGNYEDFAQYPVGCVVLDNPPFSLLSDIIRFYCDKGITFFLFGPALTLFSAPDMDVTYLIPDVEIEYENGARVRTGFITNMVKDLRIWLCPDLREAVEAAQADVDKTKQGFVYPDNIVTAATLGKIAKRGIELRIRKCSCEYIRTSDSAEEQGRSLYGGGYIMSDKAAAERAAAERAAAERAAAERAAAERAAAERAAAERAAATRLNISQRERAIIERLNKQDTE